MGSTTGDSIGSGGITELANGNYVVVSPNWTNGGAGTNVGAVTWGSGTTGISGAVSAANSLVGSTAGDSVGSGGITGVSANGDYLVLSPSWTNGGAGTNVGAVTWGSGTAGVSGAVSSTNSLVGSTTGDSIGSGGITQLFATGNYIVLSPNWNGNAGAVTWGSGTAGVSGAVSAANSLVGGTAGDLVGSGGVIEVTGGNYVVSSPNWNNGAASAAGAVTLGSGTTGVSGVVSAANSLVGTTANDNLGSGGIFPLSNGNFVVSSPFADNGALVDAGLVHIAGGAVAAGQTFGSNPAETVTIAPAAITAITNTGTALTLQANNDITLNSASDVVTSAGGNGGAITLEAGRSILLNSSITTDNGNLTLTANHPGADPANRDPGAGGITMAPGTTLNAGTGNATLTVSFGVAGAASGNLVVDNIAAVNVELLQNGNTNGSSILRAAGSSLIQATNLFMEVTGGLATGGSIGTSANPILTGGVTRLVTNVNGAGETAVSNTNGVDGSTLVVQSMRSAGGNIRLINDTDIDVTAGSCDCIRGIDSRGGNIYLQSTAGSITGSDDVLASAVSSNASFPGGGSIDLIAAQNINFTRTISSNGYSQTTNDTSPAGKGGNLNIQAGGSINLASVSAIGGDAAPTSGFGGAGGDGGSITIVSAGAIKVGAIVATGGGGSNDTGTFNGGPGGAGGTIQITGNSVNVSSFPNLSSEGSLSGVTATGGTGGAGNGSFAAGGAGGRGGSITISGNGTAFSSISVDSDITIDASGGPGAFSSSGPGGQGGGGGSITLNNAATIGVSGFIVASGGAGGGPNGGAGADGGNGGVISIVASSAVTGAGGEIDAFGGDGGSGSPGGSGGRGGSVTLISGGSIAFDFIEVTGGSGSSGNGDNFRAAPGGAGGDVTIRATGPSIQIGDIFADGGLGGADCCGVPGLTGGAGGVVQLIGDGGTLSVKVANAIDVSGGTGGSSGSTDGAGSGGHGGSIAIFLSSPGTLDVLASLAAPGGAGGAVGPTPAGPGGDGGSVFVSAVSAPPINHVAAGTPGSLELKGLSVDLGFSVDVAGGSGAGNGQQGSVHLQAGDGGIAQTGFLNFNTTDLRIETSGSVNLTNQSNVIPGIWGSVGGDLSVTSLGPIQLGLANPVNFIGPGPLTVGGNLKVQSVAGSETLAGPCETDSCIWFTNGVTAGGNIEFYANELEDSGPITTGALDTNFTRFAPWTPDTNLLLDNTIQSENYFTPHVQVGNPGALTDLSLANWGLVSLTATAEPSSFTPVTRSFEIYAHQVDIDAQIGATNAVPVSLIVKALGDINIGRNVDAPPNTTIHLADGNALTLIAGAAGTGLGNLSIGRDGAFTNLTIDYATTPSTMTLGGANINFRGPMSVVVNGPGEQVITASNAIQLVNNSTGTLFVSSQGTQQITAGSGGFGSIVLDAVGGNVDVIGGGQFVASVFQPSGAQTISIDGSGANSLIVRGGLGSASLIGGNQSITVGTGTNTGSILIQGGTNPSTTAGITNYAGPQNVSTTGQLQLIAGSAPDAAQGNFRCDLQACANLGNETGGTSQSITALGGITIQGGSGGARNEANIYSRTDQTISAPGGISLVAGTGVGPGNWASLAAVNSTTSVQSISLGAGGISLRSDGAGGNNSTATIFASGSQVIAGTGDIVLRGGVANLQAWSEITASTGQDITVRSISITDVAGPSSTGIFTQAGLQSIKTTGGAGGVASAPGIAIENLGAAGTDQNGFAAAAYLTTRTGTQSIDVADSGGISIKGTGGLAIIDGEGPSQTIDIHGTGANALTLTAGAGSAEIYFALGASQSISAGSIALTGGSQNAAIALIEASGGTQTITTTGAFSVVGGTAPGPADASPDVPPTLFGSASGGATVISRHGKQTIAADSITLVGGGGVTGVNENFANIRSDAGQDITVGAGGLTLTGGNGSGVNNFAMIENYGGDQIIRFAPGSALDITGGVTGVRNFAGIFGGGPISYTNKILNVDDPITTTGTTSQQILGGPAITLTGGATGGGGDGTESNLTRRGNGAFIIAQTGSQQIGATDVTMTGGGGAGENGVTIATWAPGASQAIDATGSISLTGGTALFASADITSGGAQTLHFSSLSMTGGSGADASASIGGGVNLDITVTGATSLTGGTGNGAGAFIGTDKNDITINLSTGSLALQAGTGDIVTNGSAAVAAIGVVKSAFTSGLPNATVTISSSGDVTLTGATTSGSQPVLALIGTDTALGTGGAVGVTTGGSIVQGNNSLIRGSSVTLSASGSVSQVASGAVRADSLDVTAASGITLSGNNVINKLTAHNQTSGDIVIHTQSPLVAPIADLVLHDIVNPSGNVALTIDSGAYLMDGSATYSASGLFSVSQTEMFGATVTSNGAKFGGISVTGGVNTLNTGATQIDNLTLSSTLSPATLRGNSTLTINDQFAWYGGTLANTGGVTTNDAVAGTFPAAVTSILRLNPTPPNAAVDAVLDTNWTNLNTHGGVQFDGNGGGNFIINAGRTFTNQGAFFIDATAPSTPTNAAITGAGTFLNRGSIIQATPGGLTYDFRLPLTNDVGGTISVTGGTLNVARLTQSGGSVGAGAGVLNVTDAFNWNSGAIAAGAAVTVASAASFSVPAGGPQTLAGTLTLDGSKSLANATLGGAGTLINIGSLALQNTTIDANVANQGTLVVSLVVPAVVTATINGALTQTGTIQVLGSTFQPASLTVANGFTNDGTITLQGGNNGYPGTLTVTNGTLINPPGHTISSITAGPNLNPNQLDAQITNQGLIDVQHNLSVTNLGRTFDSTNGALSIAAGENLTITNGVTRIGGSTNFGTGAGTLDLQGVSTLDLASGVTLPASGWKLGLSNGTVTIDSTATALPVTFTNQGTLTLSDDTITSNVALNNQGMLAVTAHTTGTINGPLTQSGEIVLAGSLFGPSVLTVANGFTNDGAISLEGFTNGYWGALAVTNGALINPAGHTISSITTGPNLNPNQIDAQITNQGLIDVQHNLAINGALTIPSTVTGVAVTGPGNLTLNGAFNWSGGTIEGPGALVTNGTSTQTNGTAHLDGRHWNNFGALAINGQVTLDNGVTLTNASASGATLTFGGTNGTPIAQGTGAPAAVINNGTFNKTGAATQAINVLFDNSGTVNVNGGVLQLAGSNGVHTGSFVANSGAELGFTGGTHVLNAGAGISGAGVVRVNGATLDVNTPLATATSFVMESGLLTGTGNLAFNGSFTFSGGTIGGTGVLTTNGTSTINNGTAHLDGRDWNNFGATTINGRVTLDNGAVLTNAIGGTLVLAGTNATPIAGGVGLPSTFDNAGTVTKTGTTPQAITAAAFNNSGTVNINAGALTLDGAFNWTGGTLSGTDTNNLTTTGTTTLNGNNKTLDGATWTNTSTGTVNWNGSGKLTITNGASLVNDGSFTVTGDGNVDALSGTNSFVNNGTFSKTGGTGALLVFGSAAPLFFDNNGLVHLQSGSLQISGRVLNGTLNVDPGLQITLNGGTNRFGDGALITGGGTVAFLPGAGGSIGFDGTTTGTTVAAGSRLSINGADVGGAGTLIDQGTLTGIGSITANLINQGTVVVPAGTNTVLDAGATGTGSYTLADTTSQLNFGSGSYTVGSITGPGGVNVAGIVDVGGTYGVSGATSIGSQGQMNINGAGTLGTLNVSGTLGGTGTVSASALNLNNGSLAGTGSLTVNNFAETGAPRAITSYSELTLTRQEGNFAVGQYTAGKSLSLTAANGSLLINNVPLSAPTLNVKATGDVVLTGGSAKAPASLQGGDVVVNGANVVLTGGAGGSLINATSSLSISTPGALTLDGTSGPASLNAGNTLSINAKTVNITAVNYAAKIDPTILDLTATGDVALKGGSVAGATAVLAGDNVTVNAANVSLLGGAGTGSYAAIESLTGNATITAANAINLTSGTGSNTDASIIAPAGTVSLNAASCSGCVALPSHPLVNSVTDEGVFAKSVLLNGAPVAVPTSATIVIPVPGAIIQGTTIAGEGGKADATGTDEEEQQSSGNQGQVSGNKPKRIIPTCI